jgi:hypothetical protein
MAVPKSPPPLFIIFSGAVDFGAPLPKAHMHIRLFTSLLYNNLTIINHMREITVIITVHIIGFDIILKILES